MTRQVWLAAWASVAAAAALPAHALGVSIDQWTIVRNGTVVLDDSFADGLAPPSGPTAVQPTYFVNGSIAPGAESGGKLALDSANGAATSNALGDARTEVNVTRLTGIASGQPSALSNADLLSASALFDFAVPPGPLHSSYGLAFTDNLPNATPAHAGQALQLFVRYFEPTARPEIAFLLQDFVAHTITPLGVLPLSDALPPGAAADQIRFTLAQQAAGGAFFGSFEFFSAGADTGIGGTLGSGKLFADAQFPYVRATVFVAQAVPEPSTYALMLGGLAAMGWLARRRR